MMSEESISEVDVPHEEFMGSTFLVDDGEGIRIAYLVQLGDSETGEYHAIELQNAEADGEIGMAYYQTHEPTLDLDDEQASAAANLLEFNQQVYILPDQQLEAESEIKIESLPEPYVEPLVPPPVIIHTPIMTNPKITKTYGGGKAAGVKKPSPTQSQSQPPESAPLLPPPAVVPVVTPVSKSKANKGSSSSNSPGPVKPPMPPPFRRKRKLILDTTKVISNAEFRKQLKEPVLMNNVSFAPSTKKAMLKMSFTGVGKFFASPGRTISSLALSQLFLSHLRMRAEIPTIPIPDSHGMLEPLDPELRTSDYSSESDGGFVSSFMTCMSKQKAEYFDALVKGMGKARSTAPKLKKPSFLSTITRDRFISPKIEYVDTPPTPGPMIVFKEERTIPDPLLLHTENGTVETETEYHTLSSSTNVQLESEHGELIISDLQPANGEFLYAESCSEPSETETVYYLNGDSEQVDEGVEMVNDVKHFQPTLYLE